MITFSTSPEVTSEYCWECLSNKWKIWWMLSSLWRATCHAWHEAYNCSTSSKYNPEKALFTLLKNEHTMKAWMAALNQKEGTTVQIQKISIKLTLHRALNIIVLLCTAKIQKMEIVMGTLAGTDLTSLIL